MMDIKQAKKAISNAYAADAIEIDGKIYQADAVLLEYKRKLAVWKVVSAVAAPLLWFIVISLIKSTDRTLNIIILILICIGYWFLRDYLIMKLLPDDCLDHLSEI